MNKLSEQYIKKYVQKVCALYNAYKVCESDIELRDVLEGRIEELLIELVDELTDESNAKEMEEYRTHLKFYGFVDANGDTSIVTEIIKKAKGVLNEG